MDIVDPRIEDYMRTLLTRYDEPVLLEMEAEGKERGFPIIGRLVGVTVELLARSIGAKRVFELGSGFGYSAYWFSRAVGPGGEVHATDGDPANELMEIGYLSRAGLAGSTSATTCCGRGLSPTLREITGATRRPRTRSSSTTV